MPVFIDNVLNLAIENCLAYPLETVFTSVAVNSMDEETINKLAALPSYVHEEREKLSGSLDTAKALLKTCEAHLPEKEKALSSTDNRKFHHILFLVMYVNTLQSMTGTLQCVS